MENWIRIGSGGGPTGTKVQGEDQGSSAEGWESLGEGLMEAERLWRL